MKNNITPWRYIGSDQHDRPGYLGSNKSLKEDIIKLGSNEFKKTVLYYFDVINNRDLRFKEAKILQEKNVKEDQTYYNKNDQYAPGTGIKGMKHRQKKVASQAWKDSRKGWVPSQETRTKWSEQRTGVIPDNNTRKKMSESRTGVKNSNSLQWEITSPAGDKFTVVSLKNYCKEHNLSYGQLYHSRGGWQVISHGKGKGGRNGTR